MRSLMLGLALAFAATTAMACDYARPTASNENSTPIRQQTAASDENSTPLPQQTAQAESSTETR